MFYVQGGGVKYRFSGSYNFRKFNGFWCGYGCIKRDNTDIIALILMTFQTLVIKILLKQKINKVLYFWVRKEVFEQLKSCHLERIAFQKN